MISSISLVSSRISTWPSSCRNTLYSSRMWNRGSRKKTLVTWKLFRLSVDCNVMIINKPINVLLPRRARSCPTLHPNYFFIDLRTVKRRACNVHISKQTQTNKHWNEPFFHRILLSWQVITGARADRRVSPYESPLESRQAPWRCSLLNRPTSSRYAYRLEVMDDRWDIAPPCKRTRISLPKKERGAFGKVSSFKFYLQLSPTRAIRYVIYIAVLAEYADSLQISIDKDSRH